MEGAFGWISDLVYWLVDFVPRFKQVDCRYGAVKFVRGRAGRELKPGLLWYWPITTKIETYPVIIHTIKMPEQTIDTKDGKTLTLKAVLVVDVDDVHKLLTGLYDPGGDIPELAMSAIPRVVVRYSYEELVERLDRKTHSVESELVKEFTQEIRKELAPYGVRLHRAAVQQFSPSRVIKIWGGSGYVPGEFEDLEEDE